VAFNYSRDMERQADDFGTRILVGGGYAADGLRSTPQAKSDRPIEGRKEKIENKENK
jgi:Zn-dependent protease with chaperone function